MEIIQFYPARLARIKVEALDDKIIFHYKNLIHETVEELDYRDIDPKVTRERAGDAGWSNIGWFFVVAAALFGWLWMLGYIDQGRCLTFAIPLFLFALIAFTLRAVIKYDYIIFRRKTGQLLLPFRLGSKNRDATEIMVERLIAKIEEANIHP